MFALLVADDLPATLQHSPPPSTAQALSIDDALTLREDGCPANLLSQGGFPRGRWVRKATSGTARHVRAICWSGRALGARGTPTKCHVIKPTLPRANGRHLLRVAATSILAGCVGQGLAHGGGLNAKGCHHDRKRGGYHCHRSPAVRLVYL